MLDIIRGIIIGIVMIFAIIANLIVTLVRIVVSLFVIVVGGAIVALAYAVWVVADECNNWNKRRKARAKARIDAINKEIDEDLSK